MPKEYEVKVLNIDLNEWGARLKSAGAEMMHNTLQRITIFNGLNGNIREYIRVRDEGDKITLTHKYSKPFSIEAYEKEIEVYDYLGAVEILESIGLEKVRIEEKKRARYKLNNSFIDIDTWPDVPTYAEIESNSESEIRGICEILMVDFNSTFKGSAHDIFRHYGIDPDTNTHMIFTSKSLNLI